jgi:outer membrane protein assembly factor BamB
LKLALTIVLTLSLSSVVADNDPWNMAGKDPAHSNSLSIGPSPPLKRAWVAKSRDPKSSFTTWPVVRDGVAYAASAGGVIAVETATGKTLWWKDFEGTRQVAGSVDETNLYMPLGQHQMAAITRQTGEMVWSFDGGEGGSQDPSAALADNRLFFGLPDANVFLCLDAATGAVLWTLPTQASPIYIPAVGGGIVVVGMERFGSSQVEFHAIEAASGRSIWSVQQRESSSSPAIFGSQVIFGGGDLQAHALDLQTGRRLWTAKLEDKFGPRNMPAIAFDDVFLADRAGHIYRLDGRTGRREWTFDASEGTMDQSFPIIAGRTLFIGSGDGELYAIDTDNGRLRWNARVRGIVLSGAADERGFYFGVKLGSDEGLHAYQNDPEGESAPSPTQTSPISLLIGGLLLVAVLFGGVVIFSRLRARSPK